MASGEPGFCYTCRSWFWLCSCKQEQLEREAEGHQRIAEVLSNKEFMDGVYRAMSDTEPAIKWENLKRKSG